MSTTEKLNHLKEILSTIFLNATDQSIEFGLQYKYVSYPLMDLGNTQKAWAVNILVKEAGYGERTIQQLKFTQPNNIDNKNMEYNVLLYLLSSITMTSLITWYEAAKMLSTDKELQTQIIHETKKGNIASN